MSLPEGAYRTPEGWIVYGDQAYLPAEWVRRGPKRPYRRLTDDERATYKRDWMRRHRGVMVGSLHDLACTGPTKATGCVCRKIRCYDRPRRAA